ncbi:MAG: hypothetical protein IKD80_07030, partial [Selenomonadaceae bacterium]|nr:hypothetical protein [Selenomonadaceae bacterium]
FTVTDDGVIQTTDETPVTIGKVVGKTVYLTKDAFAGDGSAITIGGTGYSLALSTDDGYLKRITDITESLTGGKYTASGTTEGAELDGTTKITYKAQAGGQQFNVTGLASGLTVNDGTLMLNDGTTQVGTISNGTVTLTSLAAFEGGGNSDVASIKITNVDTATSGATEAIEYKFDLSNAVFNKVDTTPTTADKEATFAVNASGTGTYTAPYIGAYTTGNDTDGYTYKIAETPAQVTITGLKAIEVSTVTGDVNGNVTNYITASKSGETTTLTLSANILPDEIIDSTSSITLTGDGYALAIDSTKTSAQKTEGSFKSGTFTAPSYTGYFTVSGNTATPTAKVDGATFTLTGNVSGTVSTSGDVSTVTDNDNQILFTVTKSGDNYTFEVTQDFLTAAGDSGTISLTGTGGTLQMASDLSNVKTDETPATFTISGGTLTYMDKVDGVNKYTLGSNSITVNTTPAASKTLFTISGLKSDLSGTVTVENNVIKVGTTAIGEFNDTAITLYRSALPETPTTAVTLTDNDTTDDKTYTLSIKDAVTTTPTADTYEFTAVTGGKTTYQIAAKPEYWTKSGNTFTYGGAATAAVKQFELSGLGDKFTSIKLDSTDPNKVMGVLSDNTEVQIIEFYKSKPESPYTNVKVLPNAFKGDSEQTITIKDDVKDSVQYWPIMHENMKSAKYGATVTSATYDNSTGVYSPATISAGYTLQNLLDDTTDMKSETVFKYKPAKTVGESVTITGLASGVTADQILPYISVSSYAELQDYMVNGSLVSGHYVLGGDINGSVYIADANVVIDLGSHNITGDQYGIMIGK